MADVSLNPSVLPRLMRSGGFKANAIINQPTSHHIRCVLTGVVATQTAPGIRLSNESGVSKETLDMIEHLGFRLNEQQL